jgi:Na+-transporting methylmalonyl-CoA/oxaloacetate decarboxylase gamma subunit
MLDFMNSLINGTNIQKGVIVTIGGMFGVFVVLILFYFTIRILNRLFPYKGEDGT